MKSYVVLVGNPIDGLTVYGPYPEEIHDVEVGEIFRNETWWIVELEKHEEIA